MATSPEIKPVSPYEVMEYAPTAKEEDIQKVIRAFNTFLFNHISELIGQGCTDVFSASYLPAWSSFHAEIVERYQKAGWIVERISDYEQLLPPAGMELKTYHCPRYKFSLPGKIIANGSIAG